MLHRQTENFRSGLLWARREDEAIDAFRRFGQRISRASATLSTLCERNEIFGHSHVRYGEFRHIVLYREDQPIHSRGDRDGERQSSRTLLFGSVALCGGCYRISHVDTPNDVSTCVRFCERKAQVHYGGTLRGSITGVREAPRGGRKREPNKGAPLTPNIYDARTQILVCKRK